MWAQAASVLLLVHAVGAVPWPVPSGTSTSTDTTGSSTTIATATASASAWASPVPSEEPLPPVQAWCPSQIFCAGDLLQTVNLADVYSDPKTIVDKPTSMRSQQVLANFAAFGNVGSITEGDIVEFEDDDFKGEGLELMAVTLTEYNDNPAFLQNVSDTLLRAFAQTVSGYWTDLVRQTNKSATCPAGTEDGPCEGTFIPLNHTFVIPGGRFREQYYWDSYWILQGLMKSELYDIANSTLQNFMDELEKFGFIPNGGRIYYLNRSQPPLFTRMVADYVATTNDTAILDRALPLIEVEMQWWMNNRSVSVTSPYTNKTYTMFRYAVNNSAPRPESYSDDYSTAFDPTLPPLDEDQRSELYAELASAAETGWDFSSRFASDPYAGGTNNTNPTMRTINVRNNVPVDLNSILYKGYSILVDFYTKRGNTSAAYTYSKTAISLREGILDLFWDPSKLAFYDFNLTSGTRNSIYTMATFYPLWNGVVPDELLESSENAFGFFAGVNMVMNRYNGSVPVTFLETGLQWDAPDAWPPHQYIILQALRALPDNVTSSSLPQPATNESTYSLIPQGQLNIAEDDLPGQFVISLSGNATKTGPGADVSRLDGTVVNGGNATKGEGWGGVLQREVANRYMTSALCSWHATGGELPGILPRLSDSELNVTQSINNTGNMFEKFNTTDVDSSGSGGQYTVQVGFGWTNGIVLWIASNYGDVLATPDCPDLLAIANATSNETSGSSEASSSTAPSSTVAALSSALTGSGTVTSSASVTAVSNVANAAAITEALWMPSGAVVAALITALLA
ncbi:glycoside hydrolase family 37 protein [Laetiporus sulphureus 93-53]|uniref:Trehalase n=1 Tax=Laetiporus sulphureus 93-53 TaxID=1314785 RepID=A0A165HJL9_9APHY|nr:glycoside hydrolase family 37 protein [Laetiporus sulphureus 93-53]KZT11812.1 glycoside hydrolase family 37 protein [Laetiporus sulphureus 93-53]